MGAACCGDHQNTPEIVLDKPTEQPKKITKLDQIALIIKVQTAFRGFMARKRVKLIRYDN